MVTVPALLAKNDAIVLLPLPALPNVESLFFQLYTTPTTALPLNVIAVVLLFVHNVWLDTAVTVTLGFTVMVKVIVSPVHPLAVGHALKLAMIGAVVLFVAVKLKILPVPFKPIVPILVGVYAQLYTTPATALPLKVIPGTW